MKNERFQITVPKTIKLICDEMLKPAGLLEPTKGVYSQFVVGLMQKQLEETIGRPMFEILIAYEAVGTDLEALKTYEIPSE